MASKLGHAGGGVLSMSVSGEQIRQELAVAAERVASMLRHLPDSGVPVPRSEWSVGETAAHLVLAAAYYSEWITGTPSPFTSRESFFTNGVARSPVNAALLSVLVETTGIDARVGQAVSLLVLAPFAFVLFKRWTFRLGSA